MLADGSPILYPGIPASSLAFDGDATLWAAVPSRGVFALRPEDAAKAPAIDWGDRIVEAVAGSDPNCRARTAGDVCFYGSPPLPGLWTRDILAEDAALWLPGDAGLVRFEGEAFRLVGEGQAALSTRYNTILRDADGSLWLGGETRGLVRLAAYGLAGFGGSEGLRGRDVVQVLDGPAGELVTVTLAADGYWLNVLSEGRFEPLRPRGLATGWGGWAWNQWVVRDRRGEWWFPTGSQGIYRYPAVTRVEQLAATPPLARYTVADGLPADVFFRAYEDRNGDLLLSAFATDGPTVVWDRASGGFLCLVTDSGLPGVDLAGPPTAFAEDASGRLWIGFYRGGVARSRDAGHRSFEYFGEADGVPATWVLDLLADSRGRLWIAAGRAVLRVDEPGAREPVFERLTAAHGLSLAGACCLAEDRLGRIYIGGSRGVDRLDPETGRVRHLTTADGLPSNLLRTIHVAADGDLWFGTLEGVARQVPREEPPARPPPVRIASVDVAGARRPVPELGATGLAGLTLRPDEHRMTVGFFGISLWPGETLRYQHRLLGVSEEWSAPTPDPAVTFAALPAGAFTFEVRAVREDGTVSAVPAALSFERRAPLWQRGWFVVLAAATVGLATWSVARLRTGRRHALERERRRIAEDLHDELGTGLARVAILSEMARRRIDEAPDEAAGLLARIGAGSRQLSETAADVVWSLDPQQDSLESLTRRLREFAGEVLSGAGVSWSLAAPTDNAAPEVGPRRRRQLLLILKEAIHNAVRHAQARRVSLAVGRQGRWIVCEVRDDGRGFDPESVAGGHGLASMRRRAEELGGELELTSRPGAGTTVRVRVPAGGGGT